MKVGPSSRSGKPLPTLFPDNDLPEIEYLYVSRMALAGASCAYQGLTRTNADITFLPTGNRDFNDVCRIFGLDAEVLKPHLEVHHIEADTVLSPQHKGLQSITGFDLTRCLKMMHSRIR